MTPYPPESIVAISIILPLIALGATFLHFWVRLKVQPAQLGLDDWLIVAAVVLCLGDGANLALAAIIGIQGREYEGPPPDGRAAVEATSDYAQVILEKPLYGFMKLSVLFFYRRIFSVKKGFRICNNIMIVFIILWTLAFFIAEFVVCGGKREAFWVGGKGGVCEDRNWLHLAFSATDVVGDVLVVVMPFPFISGLLQIGPREKVAVLFIFLLGTLSTAASIVRLGFISQAVYDSNHPELKKHKSGAAPGVWSTVEAAIGCLAANLPPLGPLIRRAPSPHKLSLSVRNRYRSYSKGYSEPRSGRKGSSIRLGSMDDPLRKESRQYGIPDLELTEVEVRGRAEGLPV